MTSRQGASVGDEATAALLAQIPSATVFTLGDNAYVERPAVGVHELLRTRRGARTRRGRGRSPAATTRPRSSGGALPNQGFSDYFAAQLAPYGETATDRLKSYYSYDVGAWHVVALNSACYYDLPGCNTAHLEQWFRADLASHTNVCTAVMWHDSRWSSGNIHGNQDFTQPLWQIAYDGGADIVLGGNEHDYERFAPQDANGALDNAYGVRQFVVGTGGYYLYGLGTRKPNSEVFKGDSDPLRRAQADAAPDELRLAVPSAAPARRSPTPAPATATARRQPPTGTPTVRSELVAARRTRRPSLTIAKPQGTRPATCCWRRSPTRAASSRDITPPAGWSAVPNTSASEGANARIHGFYRVAGGAEPASYTFTLTGGSGTRSRAASWRSPAPTRRRRSTRPRPGEHDRRPTRCPRRRSRRRSPGRCSLQRRVNQPVLSSWPPQLMPEPWDVRIDGGLRPRTRARRRRRRRRRPDRHAHRDALGAGQRRRDHDRDRAGV